MPAAATASGGRATNSLISLRVTAGDSSESPRITMRSACSNSAGWVSFSRNPLAPARSARKMYSSSPKLVRITTRTSASRSSVTICLVASMPSTAPASGCRRARCPGGARVASATACFPSAASATTSMSSSASSSALMPLRISAWSSASRTLIMTVLGTGISARTRKPPPACGPACSRPPSADTRSRIPIRPSPGPWTRVRGRRCLPRQGARGRPSPSSSTWTVSVPAP